MNAGRPMIQWVPVVLSIVMIAFVAVPTFADERMEANQLVEKSKLAFESFMSDSNLAAVKDLIKKAQGVFICPQLLKGAFVFGVSGGSGTMLVRDAKNGQWNGPAFYTLGGASFGLQIGGEASEVVLLAMTQRGVKSFLSSNFKLGADAGLAVGPIGAGASAATANLSADILSFSRSKGLYGGISLDGAVVATRDSWNQAYYGRKVTPTDILIQRKVTNPHASDLIGTVSKVAGGR